MRKPAFLFLVLVSVVGGRAWGVRTSVLLAESALPAHWQTILSTQAPPVSSTYVWRSVDNHAFHPGEDLSFVIKWGLVSGGYADLILQGPDRVDDRLAYHLVSETHSTGIVETFYHVQDRHDIWIDTQSLVTLRYDKRVDEGHYRIQEHSVLYHPRGWYVMNDYRFDKKLYQHSEGKIPPYCLDVLGALYYVRTLPLRVGATYTIDVISSDKIYPLIVKVKRRETIKVPAGRFDCFLVEPLLRSRDVFVSKGKKLEVWMTADDRHMPVRMRSEVTIGHVSAELVNEHQDPLLR